MIRKIIHHVLRKATHLHDVLLNGELYQVFPVARDVQSSDLCEGLQYRWQEQSLWSGQVPGDVMHQREYAVI